MASAVPFTEDDLRELYMWVDEIPISRPKRNIARDFADGCSVAEILKFFFPKLVELHNYIPSMSRSRKLDNWATLNARVFRKLYFEVPLEEVEDIINAVPGAIERFLRALRVKIAQIKERREDLSQPQEVEDVRGRFTDPNADGQRPSSSIPSRQQGQQRNLPSPQHQQQQHSTSPQVARRSSGTQGQIPSSSYSSDTARALLEEKDRTIMELRETVGILSEKIMKLEELVRVKDEKLTQYRTKFGRM